METINNSSEMVSSIVTTYTVHAILLRLTDAHVAVMSSFSV